MDKKVILELTEVYLKDCPVCKLQPHFAYYPTSEKPWTIGCVYCKSHKVSEETIEMALLCWNSWAEQAETESVIEND